MKHTFYKDSPSVFQLGGIIEAFVHILEKYLRKLVYFDGIVLSNDFFLRRKGKDFQEWFAGLFIYLFIYLFVHHLDLDIYFIKL